MDNNIKEIVERKKVKEDKLHKTIIVHGAGKFNSDKLYLSKTQAMLLYIDLHKILFNKENNNG